MNLLIWVAAALIDWLIIGVALYLSQVYSSWWIWLVALLVVGNRLHALSILGHDGGHRLICKNKKLNDALTYIFTFGPLFASIRPYRDFHFSHHRNVGTDHDPELKLQLLPQPILNWKNVGGRFLLDMLGGGIPEMVAFAKVLKPASVVPFLWWAAFLTLMIGGGWYIPLIVFSLSTVTSYWAFFRLRTYTEHYRTKGTHIIRPNPLIRLICPHNTWCHYEHHKYPNIPFWQLPSVRRSSDSGHYIIETAAVKVRSVL